VTRGIGTTLAIAALLGGCYTGLPHGGADGNASAGEAGEGGSGEDGSGSAGDDDDPEPVDEDAVGISGLRRLSAVEYDATVVDLVGVSPDAELVLPEDLRSPFDNDYTFQSVSAALIEGADLLAGEVAEQVVADPTLRDAIMPCQPASPTDEACLREFIASFGKRALRRSLTEDEITNLAGFIAHAEEAGDFWVAVDSVLRTLLQHTELLYRVEIGTPVDGEPGLFRLGGTEVATRLSYLLWGSTPPEWLIDAGENGELSNAEEIAVAAQMLLDDPHARARIYRFHGMWMGFEHAGGGDLGDAMTTETRTLIERTVFDEKSAWADLLRAEETFVSPELATHYGLPAPAGGVPGWVPYGDSGRRGLLSHATFLSVGTKNGDTSATLRGKNIRVNLLCQDIPPPPPDVNKDAPPPGFQDGDCKARRYEIYGENDGCAACHSQMDPIGLGLEAYDSSGVWRTNEPDRPDCPIDGVGTIAGVGEFEGPAGLADLLVAQPQLPQCIATQVYRFAIGRTKLDATDTKFVDNLLTDLGDAEIVLDQLLLGLVTSSEFRHRREEDA
jgi:hypothetical protein